MDILFTKTIDLPMKYQPKPASMVLPEWYKKIDSYIEKEKKPIGEGQTSATIKKCMPVFDSITAGYILFTQVDVWISQKNNQPWYEWPAFSPIDFHPIEQAPNHPSNTGHKISYPKWINPWAIKTPKGYSTLFVQPFHRESVFTIMPGVVDTDEYDAPVNFPFVLNNTEYKGIIPAGTPMAQVIPFKRESWNMKFGTQKELQKQYNTTLLLKTKIFDSYKTYFRKPKEYK